MKGNWLKIMAMFCWIAGFASCSDDESGPRLTNPVLLTEEPFMTSNKDFTISWNGKDTTDIVVSFAADAENPDKLQMSWTLAPYGEISLPDMEIDVERGVHQLTLSGSVETGNQIIELSGFYDELKFTLALDVKARLKIPELTNRSFTYRFTPDVFEIRRGANGYLTWQGQTMEVKDFVEESLSLLMNRLSKRIEAIRLTFRDDYYLDLEVKAAWATDFIPYLSLPFSVSPYRERELLTYVSYADEFAIYQMFAKAETGLVAVFNNMLYVAYECDEAGCAWTIPPRNFVNFLGNYVYGYYGEELIAEEQEQLQALYEILKEGIPMGFSINEPWTGTWQIFFHSSDMDK